MTYCYQCRRWFNSEHGLQVHLQNSAAHQSEDEEEFECDACDRCFDTELSLHQHCSNSAGHPYCVSCKRMFMNQNNLNQHLHSKTHLGSHMECPFCKTAFTTASGVTIHIESGNCAASGLNRHKLNNMIHRLDQHNVITRPLLTMPGYEKVETFATKRSWNGHAYKCYLCPKEFETLPRLNQHIASPAHEQSMYRCPKAGCGGNYKLLSGLIQHIESERCGLMSFIHVQRQAKNGIESFVGKMITAT